MERIGGDDYTMLPDGTYERLSFVKIANAPIKTLLDEFAMAAIQRWMVDRDDAEAIRNGGVFNWDMQAKECYDFAEAMMAEKERREKSKEE